MKTVNFKAKALLSVMLVSLFAAPMAQAMVRTGASNQQRSPLITAAIVAAGTTLAALLGISSAALWRYITGGSNNRIKAPEKFEPTETAYQSAVREDTIEAANSPIPAIAAQGKAKLQQLQAKYAEQNIPWSATINKPSRSAQPQQSAMPLNTPTQPSKGSAKKKVTWGPDTTVEIPKTPDDIKARKSLLSREEENQNRLNMRREAFE